MAGTLPRPKRKSTKSAPVVSPEEVLYTDTDRDGDTLDVELTSLCPNPFNKRKKKGVPELAATIREVGLLQNIAHIRAETWIAAYPETKDQITAPNVILFGEHRWLAAQELGWETIPSVLSDGKVDEARLITLIENLRRAQLDPLEEAEHYKGLRAEGLSYEQIAEKVGETAEGAISKGTVWKRAKLLELAPEMQQALKDGTLKVSAAEKAQKLSDSDQRAYLGLVRNGVRPAEAHAQILARQHQTVDAPVVDKTVSNGNGPAKQASAGTGVASKGNAKPAQPAPPAQRKPQSAEDKDDADRRAAAAARDAACRLLLETTDLADPATHELVLGVLATAILAPQQQSAAQQRAFTWLKETGRQGLDAADAAAYFAAVQESGDAAVQRLAAFAVALAAAELRTIARRRAWGSREHAHLRVLQEHAEYEPQTEWEKSELGLATVGGSR
ncbi:ParB/RepB/Spo0J family partition protein [Streptomyces rimosus]|uniref:ParB/RepB/Spo0J family partition protein n=1 Tax=Streptomyces rimosus TaxID=1927 RepID=UPI0004C91983|nr:ParB N-terminal domain-containing protein [Streptomyces rimosus]